MIIYLNGLSYDFRTTFPEVTVRDFHRLYKDSTPRGVLRALCNAPRKMIEDLTDDQAESLSNYVTWMDGDFEYLATPSEVDIGQQPWYKLEQAREIVNGSSRIVFSVFKLFELYTGNAIPEVWDASEFFGQGWNILEGIVNFLKKFEELQNGEKPTEDEIEAGIETLQSFGTFATLYNLAKGDPRRYSELQELPAYDIYMTMLYEHAQEGYRKNLQDINKRQDKYVPGTRSKN